MENSGSNSCRGASYLDKLRNNKIIVLTDLDGTLTVNSSHISCPRELEDRAQDRQLLEERGVVTGAVTHRTRSMTLTERSYLRARELGLDEDPPLWGRDENGLHRFVDLAEVPFFKHSLEWDIVGSCGGGLMYRTPQGYVVDREYDQLLNYDYAKGGKLNPEPWRDALLHFLFDKYREALEDVSLLESQGNYKKRKTNSPPSRFRLEFKYRGSEGYKRMMALMAFIEEEQGKSTLIALRTWVSDESKIDEEDPEKSEYTLYLMPWGARKEKMISWGVSRSIEAAGMRPEEVDLLYADDTLTGFRVALYGGRGMKSMTSLIPRHARIAPAIINRRSSYGGEDLSFLWKGNGRTTSRLVPDPDRKGVYHFFVHKVLQQKNTIVIADERYPEESTAPGSLRRFHEEFLPTVAPAH